jgi:hypothetical protein
MSVGCEVMSAGKVCEPSGKNCVTFHVQTDFCYVATGHYLVVPILFHFTLPNEEPEYANCHLKQLCEDSYHCCMIWHQLGQGHTKETGNRNMYSTQADKSSWK